MNSKLKKMNTKTKNIIFWVLTGLVAFVFLGSAYGKITGNPEGLKMAENFGLNTISFKLLGFIELAAIVLFIIPRTGVIGTLLLVAYMGGGIATHLEHGQSVIAPIVISAFVWIVGMLRFPEFSTRILGK